MNNIMVALRYSILVTIWLGFGVETSHAQVALDQIISDSSLSARTVQLISLVTVLSLAPGIAVMITCFPFIVTVFSILRQAIGLQQSPPNMLIVSLSLFLTYFIMEPVFLSAWLNGLSPLIYNEITVEESFARTVEPFRSFMIARIDSETYDTMISLRPDSNYLIEPEDASLAVIIPSFLLSEISLAFQIGFLVFLPFLLIDLVVAAVLMSMGMMMVPPAIVSLPFKLAFFTIADGWSLVSGALVRGYLN
jgi:flagellar biosynthesis protein FliP